MDDMEKRMPRRTFQEQLVDRLGQEICSGVYTPGQMLPAETVLGERFGVSRIVVREAVKSLAAKGLVDVRRKTGTVIQQRDRWQLFDPDVVSWHARSARIDERFVADLLELRRVVEPAAARMAAARADQDDREAIRGAFDQMVRAVNGDGDYIVADLAFHTAILKASHNQFLWQMHSALAVLLRTSFEISMRPEGPLRSLSMHGDLCASIEAGNADAAERAVLALIERASDDLSDTVDTTALTFPAADPMSRIGTL